jgi:ABC-2 type transport system permease protein
MVAKGVGSASNLPLPLLLLPFFGSGFVPTGSMPEPLRAFAENQPFTPMIEAIRGLLLGTPVGNSVVLAAGLVDRVCRRRLSVGDASVRPRPRSLMDEVR